MKLILKILSAPVIIILWLVTSVLGFILKISATVLLCFSVLFVISGIIKMAESAAASGLIALVIAFLLCPCGLPMLAAKVLARFYALRFWLKEKIYG